MIKFENTDVMNFEGALRGMRNPLNSWDKSDSIKCYANPNCIRICKNNKSNLCIGVNDLKLAQNLIKAGPDHRKFLRQIFVSVDITAPLYWWKEFDTYKVATVANSCSTMHKIHAKEFTLDDFSYEHLYSKPYQRMFMESIEVDEDYTSTHSVWSTSLDILKYTIEMLNCYRNEYLLTKDKDDWWQMIQLLPSSYNQKRTVTLNYETIRNIYGSRKNHKLDEWSAGFMEWIDTLPYAEELIKC